MGGAVDHILNVDQGWLYLIVFALVFAEDALFFGFVIPGETAAVLAGVQAWRGQAHLSVVMIVVVLAAIIGDSVGFEIGKHFGPRLMRTRMLRNHQERLEQARGFLARRGGLAVFLGRFVAFFRATMPALAGISRMPYRKFLFYNALGGIVWGITFTTLGFQAGESYHRVEHQAGRGAAIAAAAVVVALLLVWKIRSHRAEKDPEPAEVDPQVEERS
jgi:membrane protein DedA with SNARE-associated domain